MQRLAGSKVLYFQDHILLTRLPQKLHLSGSELFLKSRMSIFQLLQFFFHLLTTSLCHSGRERYADTCYIVCRQLRLDLQIKLITKTKINSTVSTNQNQLNISTLTQIALPNMPEDVRFPTELALAFFDSQQMLISA